jgi:hypothetical protein
MSPPSLCFPQVGEVPELWLIELPAASAHRVLCTWQCLLLPHHIHSTKEGMRPERLPDFPWSHTAHIHPSRNQTQV